MKHTKSAVKLWRRQKKIRSMIGWRGKIVSYTKIRSAGRYFSKFTPYYIVLAEDDKGKRFVAQLVEGDTPQIGKEVEAIVRRSFVGDSSDLVVYGIKFRLID